MKKNKEYEEMTEKATEEVTEEATEEVTEEATEEEAPVEAEDVEEESTEETSQDNAENQDENEDDTAGIAKVFKWLLGTIGVVALIGILIMLMLMYFGDDNQSTQDGGANTDNGVVDTTPGGDEVPGTDAPADIEFDMDSFVASVTNIAKEYDEDVAAFADILCNDTIGEDKLKELIETYDETTAKKHVAYTVLIMSVKKEQYITQNGLNYNPNAVIDYSNKLQGLDDTYRNATGKNPDGALMSLPGYDSYNGNRDALRALITESGDMALLTWYNAKMEIYDTMRTQTADTDKVQAYVDSVKAELLASAGTIKLLELQMEKEAAGQLTVVDNVSMTYTDDYYKFVLNNYIYVLATN